MINGFKALKSRLGAIINKGLFNTWWDNAVETSPFPPIRSPEVAFVHLYKRVGADRVFVGSFLPELYHLANTKEGSLSCQQEERAWKKARKAKQLSQGEINLYIDNKTLYNALYRADGKRKTPFELAVIPFYKIADISKAVSCEFKYQRDHQKPLPPPVSRYRIIPEFLHADSKGDLGNSGLTFGLSMKDKPNTVYTNVWNLAKKASSIEKVIHYLCSWAAIFEAITIAAGFSVFTSLPGLAIGMSAILLAIICAKVCTQFQVAENLTREIRWLISSDFNILQGKLSLKNSLLSAIKLAAISLVSYGMMAQQWGAITSLGWSNFAAIGMPMSLAFTAKYALATFLTCSAGAGALVGLCFTMRYIFGLTFYDHQIEVTPEMANALPIIEHKKAKKMGASEAKSATTIAPMAQTRILRHISNPQPKPTVLSTEKEISHKLKRLA